MLFVFIFVLMRRTYKRKLILTVSQERKISSWIGVCRLVYNMGLEIKTDSYKKVSRNISNYDLQKQVKDIRQCVFIKPVPTQSLKCALNKLDCSFNRFFSTHKSGGGYPRFANKKHFKSIDFYQNIKVIDNKIKLSKIGWLKMFKDTEIVGTIKTATVKIEPDGFFVTIVCDQVPQKFVSENQAIGLDMGISKFCTDSNGGVIDNPKHFKKYEKQLRIENRSLSRKVKGSNSWKKQAKRLSLLHHKIGNVRKDFLHKESTKIAKANSTVYMEDLKIKNMTKNTNLSKHILDAGWGMFKTMLQYKTNVVLIDPKYTSQMCHECKEVDKKSRLSQSEYVCTSCGHVSNADINAAKNIKSKGIALDRQREALACA